jgi:hypothetical protein
MVFLFLLSYVLLFHFDPITTNPLSIHPTEFVVIIIVTCMFIEEVRIVRIKNLSQGLFSFI